MFLLDRLGAIASLLEAADTVVNLVTGHRCGSIRVVLPEAPEGAAVLLGEHRPPPRSPPLGPRPPLQPAAGPRGQSGIPRRADADVLGRHLGRAAEALGRGLRPARDLAGRPAGLGSLASVGRRR